MSAVLLIARRELAGYLKTMSGYVIIAAVLAITGLLFNVQAMEPNKVTKSAEVISQFFYFMSGTTMIASVFISMRLLAEERQSGTLALLYSSPVRDYEIVLGKFLSALAFLAVMIGVSVFLPALVGVNGKLSVGQVAAGYLGLLLLGSACLAIGTFGSALARNQVVAAIGGGCILVAMVVAWLVSKVAEAPLKELFGALSLWQRHFPPFQAGVVHLRDVVYYGVVTYVFLFASTRVLEARRWR